MLKAKHIVLGITGGIAAYKAPLLIRLLTKAGAEVKCCCTKAALQFTTELTLQTLSNNPVYTDLFAPHNQHSTNHIALHEWADLLIVAPATANFIGKAAAGIADDALTTTFLAFNKPVIIAPAMNTNMLLHPAVQHNLHTLQQFPNITILPTDQGPLACGTVGAGRMAEPQDILQAAYDCLTPKTLSGKRIIITAGPTHELIDPVRFISNYSSGKMGYAIAELAKLKGADVTLISGPTNLHFSGKTIHVTSAQQMYQAAIQLFPNADIAILAAAVADFTITNPAQQKIKHQSNSLTLNLTPTKDIAAELGNIKKHNQTIIGFALETNNELENAQLKLHNKHFDYIVLNSLNDPGAGFAHDTNKITIIQQNGQQQIFPLKSKTEVAADILQLLE